MNTKYHQHIYVLQQAGLGGVDGQKFSLANPTFEPKLALPISRTPKPWLQNHLNSLDTPNA
jgi:hypothetical protein